MQYTYLYVYNIYVNIYVHRYTYPSSDIHGSGKWIPPILENISFLSFKAVVRVHDCGRKGKSCSLVGATCLFLSSGLICSPSPGTTVLACRQLANHFASAHLLQVITHTHPYKHKFFFSPHNWSSGSCTANFHLGLWWLIAILCCFYQVGQVVQTSSNICTYLPCAQGLVQLLASLCNIGASVVSRVDDMIWQPKLQCCSDRRLVGDQAYIC